MLGRRADLEKKNCHIVIIDVLGIVNCRILNVYRSFRPPGLLSPNTFFDKQLEVISGALTSNSIVLGDFNLDAKMSNVPDYHRKIPLENLNLFALNENLVQLVKECTWSRVVNGSLKESILDHIYVTFYLFEHTFASPITITNPVLRVVLSLIAKRVFQSPL